MTGNDDDDSGTEDVIGHSRNLNAPPGVSTSRRDTMHRPVLVSLSY